MTARTYDWLTPETLLSREHCAEALTEFGFPITEKTLATRVTRGRGPAYAKFNGRAIYRWGDALAWARAAMSPKVTMSSELKRQPLAVEA
jgi:hypothetical protein